MPARSPSRARRVPARDSRWRSLRRRRSLRERLAPRRCRSLGGGVRGAGDACLATVDAQALDAARVGVENLELELVRPGDQLAARGDASGEGDDEAAEGVDLLGGVLRGEVDSQGLRDLLQARPGIGDEGVPVAVQDQAGGRVVVLVLDVADDHLDQVLDRDEAVGAAVLVDHQRHVGAGRLHAHEQVEGRHRARDEEDRAQDPGRGDRRREVDVAEPRRLTGSFARRRREPVSALAAMWSRKSRMCTMPWGSSSVSP